MPYLAYNVTDWCLLFLIHTISVKNGAVSTHRMTTNLLMADWHFARICELADLLFEDGVAIVKP